MAERPQRSESEREAARRAREARRSGSAGADRDGGRGDGGGVDGRLDGSELDGNGVGGGGLRGGAGEGVAPDPGPRPSRVRPAPRRAPSRRTSRTSRTRERAARPARARPRAPRTAGSRRSAVRLLALVPLVLMLALIWFLAELFQPFAGDGHGSVVVTIPASSGADQVGSILSRDGVVSSGFFFKLRATLDGDRGKLLSGRYRMKHGMSYSAALKILTTAPKSAPVKNVTIVDGQDRWQLSHLLHQEGVKGDYFAETRHSKQLDPARYGAPRSTPSLEGFLYPDTYQLRLPLSIPTLVAEQLSTFKQKFATVNMAYARSLNLTPYDVLIVASLTEAEATTQHDRSVVASVILNRLRLGMTLGLDTTVAYAVNNYSGSLTQSQLASRSPWNTTVHTGLPPTPIDSPTLSAIQAAAHPPKTNYLYFIVKVCGNGALAFTSSYSQFLGLSRAYQTALDQRGLRRTEFCSARHG